MPTYSYQCQKCDFIQDEFRWLRDRNRRLVCPCGGGMKRVFTGSMIEVWKPIVLDHIADQPMMFDSKRKLQQYCKKNGLSSGALL